MAGSFWIVYLVSQPQALDFDVAALLWVVAFGTAAVVVVWMSRGRPTHARTSMTLGLVIMAACHVEFAVLPASWIVLVGGVAFGVYLPLFWLPMNSLLVRETSPANRAGRLAAVTATFTTVAIVAPILGGFLANVAGYRVVFGLGGVIVAGSLLLVRRRVGPSESFAFSIDLRRTAPRTALAFSGQGGVDGIFRGHAPGLVPLHDEFV
jgi:MFS family permease